MKQAVQVAEAQDIVLSAVAPLGAEKVPLLDALHRVSAEAVNASRDIPLSDNSAMDGYAVRHADVAGSSNQKPAVLDVLETLPAGKAPQHPVTPGTAVKIMTGAPLPAGADTVVQIEHTNADDARVAIYAAPPMTSNLRRRGEDIHAGECVLGRHTLLRPAELGVLASVGQAQVWVYQRPRVAILATGDEIADPGDPGNSDKILNSNSYTLAGQVTEAGGVPVLLGVAPDRREVIRERLASGLRADVLITSGGVSVGQFDFVRECLERAGLRGPLPHRGHAPRQPDYVRSGAARAGVLAARQSRRFNGHVRALRAPGAAENDRAPRVVPAARRGRPAGRRGEAPRRAHLSARRSEPGRHASPTVTTTGPQGSGILRSMSLANCLIDIPEAAERLSPGDPVAVMRI